MDSKFLSFVWRYSKREQIFILILTVVSFPFVYLSLEIPKIIINEAIDGSDFPKVVLGFEFEQIPYLILLCFAFLAMVVAINGIKWLLNVSVGMTGERMLRRLRYMLFERVMRFRVARFRTTKPGEVIQSMLGEIEPLGGFIGEVVSTPAFQGGLLCVYMVFIFMQHVWLGLAAVALYPLQAFIIPKLQKRVIQLNRERAQNTRFLAETVSESVGNAGEIRTNATARWHMAQLSHRLHTNTLIRMSLFKRKFTIKFINNFMNQLTPFFLYLLGGYLVIRGRLDFGALVAVLAAYKDLAAPWKEVLAWYQRWTDFNSRYTFVIENFIGDDVLDEDYLQPPARARARLEAPLTMTSVDGGPGSGGLGVRHLEVAAGETVAVLGGENGARESFLRLASGLDVAASGSVSLGGTSLADATLPQVGESLAYVGTEPGMVNDTLRVNLLYGLLRRVPDLAGQTGRDAEQLLQEAQRTGNLAADPEGDWIDYEAAGVDGAAALEERLVDVIGRVGLGHSTLARALETRLTPEEAERWTPALMQARSALNDGWPAEEREDLLERWEPERFNSNATLLENVLFGLPVSGGKDIAGYAELDSVRAVLGEVGARPVLEAIGLDIAREFASLVEAVGETSSVLDGFAAYPRARILAAAELTALAVDKTPDAMKSDQRAMLLSLAAVYVDQRDRLDVLGPARIERVLACREKARRMLAEREDFVAFDEERVSPAETVAENIVNAKRRFDRRAAWRKLDERLEQAIRTAGLRGELMSLGLDAPVGAGGSALSSVDRRRTGLARALMKRPSLIVLDGVAAGPGTEDVTLRATVRELLPDAIILLAAADGAVAAEADRVLVIGDDGGVVEEEPRGPERVAGGGRA
ncbi:MAG TPA: ABC transporter transmembrane domain-containing protein [Thermohalobaculum sp.]|nr:ABC transporter transmembrane domain-containing protein [Thermohalobaculum sp.]